MKTSSQNFISCTVRLEESVADKLAQRLRTDGRAHALFDLWRNLVNQPNALGFLVKPNREAKQAFHSCIDCGEPFTSSELVLRHYRNRHADKAVKTIQKTIDPPKGNFQFLAKCGLCKMRLCPPNFHEFSVRLMAHHKERHDHVPFEDFRARIVNSTDPADLEAWKTAASVIEELHCAFCDAVLVDDREAVEHFKTHADKIAKEEPELIVKGPRVKQMECRDLRRVCSEAWDKEKKQPGHFLALLRHSLNQHGLQLFRDVLGHQFACRYHPRAVTPRDQLTPRQQEVLTLAAAPARRGHKPNRHTLRDHFQAQGVSEADLKADMDVLLKLGLLIEFDNGQLDALGIGSHISAQ